MPESDTASICSSFRGKSAAYIYFLQRIYVLLDIFCRSGTIKVIFEEGRDMSEWEEDLLALFDTLDEAAQAEALAAALKIIGGEIL